MARYYFTLFNGEPVDDRPDGMDLPNLTAARRHAIAVARDLVKNQPRTELRGWTLAVQDDEGQALFDILLSAIDHETDGDGP